MKKAREIMTQNPRCCMLKSSVYEAVTVMKNEDCGVVPVVDQDGKCVGIVTDRDICLKVVLDRKDPETTSLQDIMTPNPVTCRAEDSLDDIIRKMEKYMVRRILVVDDNNKCIGIISEADIALKVEDKRKVAELIEAVSH